MDFNTTSNRLREVVRRIREMREITGLTEQEMASETDVAIDTYRIYEAGTVDLPFTFIHKCTQLFGLPITDL